MAKQFRVVFQSKTVKALRNPDDPACRIHFVAAADKDEAVKLAKQIEMRHATRLLQEKRMADAEGRKVDAKFLEQRADLDDWKMKSAEEVK